MVPFWSKDPKIGSRMITARAEVVHEKRVYRKWHPSRRSRIRRYRWPRS
ncbi:SOS response-associated peptidase family protein [Rhodococcus sp. 3A]